MHPKVDVERLRGVAVVAPDDAYDLARLILKLELAGGVATGQRSRTTVHGLSGKFAMLADMDRSEVERRFVAHGLDPAATIEPAGEPD